ncbi:MAG: aminotransferase class I and II [Muribaculaceae bacterium]|nr:aminotransferase class I and II [Muribaculaceae bacterium]
MELREERLTRYIEPLREGGSLPALAEAGDGFKYVVKLRGAGHGSKSLIAELIGGMVAKAFKFNVPELVFLELSGLFGITEPDREIQELLRKSEGKNLGLHFLGGAYTFDPEVNEIDPLLASKIVWLDAFLENVDRSRQNPNMMIWKKDLWLIDHGASLYFHHSGRDAAEAALDPFPYIRNHALLPKADRLEEADKLMRQAITPRTLNKIVDLIPDVWLIDDESGKTPSQIRDDYKLFLTTRLANSSIFVRQAIYEKGQGPYVSPLRGKWV